MQIAKDTVVSIDYRLHLGDGKIIDESEPGDPLVYLHGYEEIVPGLEKALEGKKAGESLKVVVAPKDGLRGIRSGWRGGGAARGLPGGHGAGGRRHRERHG